MASSVDSAHLKDADCNELSSSEQKCLMSSADAALAASVRALTLEEEELLKRQNTRIVPLRKQEQLEVEARKHWDLFYKRNSTKFFKDRHWTTREFEELSGAALNNEEHITVLEVGCGVGNFMFPLLNETNRIQFYACDFSPRAVQFIKENPQFDSNRCHPFCCDVTCESLENSVSPASVDIATLIFCLSAIHPDKMAAVLRNISTVLKPGGCVLIRDYGIYDHAMMRFGPGNKLMDRFYVRQDGTRAYYFSQGKQTRNIGLWERDKLQELFHSAGFKTSKIEYVYRETVNRKQGLCVPRVFVQAKFTLNDCNFEFDQIG